MTKMRPLIKVSVFLLIATCTASAQEGFKLEPIPKDVAEIIGFKSNPVRDGLHPRVVKKKPANSAWGILQEPYLAFAVCRATPEGDFETVIFDSNQNQDLTDDEEYPLDKPFSAKLPRMKSQEMIIRPCLSKKGTYVLSPIEWYRGKIKVGDKTYESVLIDNNLNGLVTKELGDLAVLDSNGDGRFDLPGMQGMSMDACIPLWEKRVCLFGDVWDLELDVEKPEVKLSDYKGDCGRMKIKTDFPRFDGVFVDLDFIRKNKKSHYFQNFRDEEMSCRIPVEDYYGAKFNVYLKKEGKVAAELNYGILKPKVKKDETSHIELGFNPPKISVVVGRKGNKLNIGRKLETEKNGLILFDMSLYDKNGTKKPTPAPAVEVRTVDGDKLIASGNMEYG